MKLDLRDPGILKICVNLARRPDRWRAVKEQFHAAGLEVLRMPGVPGASVRDPRGFQNGNRYACSLSKRMAIRQARLRGAHAIMLFEDDVILAPDLHQRLAEINIPDDWGLFFLGGRHMERPVAMGGGLVRCTSTADHHALLIRDTCYDMALRTMAGTRKRAPCTILFDDMSLAATQSFIPSYAAWPNLAWQALSFSENDRREQSHYDASGRQSRPLEPLEGIDAEMAQLDGTVLPDQKTQEPPPGVPRPPSLISLADSPRQHVLEETFPLMKYLNLRQREDRRNEASYQFFTHGLNVQRFPAVNGRSVHHLRGYKGKGQYACALSHRMILREARQKGAPAVLIFEDDINFNPHFRDIAEGIALPDDWGIFYYGCSHIQVPEIVGPGLVRVTSALETHAYAVRAPYYNTVIHAMRYGTTGTAVRACDLALAELHRTIPTYAVYPNIAIQAPGESDIEGMARFQYQGDGTQAWRPETLWKINEAMWKLVTPKQIGLRTPFPSRA